MNYIPLREIIPYLNLKRVKEFDNYYQACCPIHNDQNPSFYIYKNSYQYVCFSCSAKGSIYKLLYELTGKKISNIFDMSGYKDFLYLDKKKNINNKKKEKNSSFKIDGIFCNVYTKSSVLSYLKDKQVTDIFIKDMQIQYMDIINITINKVNSYYEKETIKKQYRNRLLIPIIENKQIINYEFRDYTKKQKPKVLYIAGQKTNILFNKDNLNTEENLYVVEGIFDLPLIYTYISKNCTSLFGASITEGQITELSKFKNIIIIPDNDPAGKTVLKKIDSFLNKDFYIAFLNKSKDPGEASLIEIEKAIKNKISSVEFFCSEKKLIKPKNEIFW